MERGEGAQIHGVREIGLHLTSREVLPSGTWHQRTTRTGSWPSETWPAAQRLRQSLLAVIARLASLDGEVTASQLTELIERMITMDGKLTREQLDQMTEERSRMTASLAPGQLVELQRQRAEQVSGLAPEQLAEMQRQRRQLLPDDFPCDEARLAILQSQPETRVRRVF